MGTLYVGLSLNSVHFWSYIVHGLFKCQSESTSFYIQRKAFKSSTNFKSFVQEGLFLRASCFRDFFHRLYSHRYLEIVSSQTKVGEIRQYF